MEAKIFLSGEKTRHYIECLSCSAVKIVNGYWAGLPSVTVSIFGNLELNFSAISECSGAKGRADK